MNKITTIAIDLAKHVFQVAAEDARGEEMWQKRLRSRAAMYAFIQDLSPPLKVGLEAGLGAQAWARLLAARGLEVCVLPAQRVAEHRSGAKNDCNDARAILRALHDRSIHPVPVKSVTQLTMQALLRVRAGWQRRRTSAANQMRGLLLEHAVAIAQGDAALARALERVLPDAQVPIPDRLRALLAELAGEWEGLGQRVRAMDPVHDPGYRSGDGHGLGLQGIGPGTFPQCPPICGVLRAGSRPAQQRQPAPPRADEPARRSLSARAPGQRRTRGAAPHPQRRHRRRSSPDAALAAAARQQGNCGAAGQPQPARGLRIVA